MTICLTTSLNCSGFLGPQNEGLENKQFFEEGAHCRETLQPTSLSNVKTLSVLEQIKQMLAHCPTGKSWWMWPAWILTCGFSTRPVCWEVSKKAGLAPAFCGLLPPMATISFFTAPSRLQAVWWGDAQRTHFSRINEADALGLRLSVSSVVLTFLLFCCPTATLAY